MKEIRVGLGTCGVSAGGIQVFNTLKSEIDAKKLKVVLKETGCMGMCYEEVLVEVVENGTSFLYAKINPEKAKKIIDQHIIDDRPIEEWIVNNRACSEKEEFFKKQKRIVLRNCGVIDPGSIDEYITRDGYKAIQKVLKELSPEEIIDIIYQSGLRGRGGGGFLTGLKWRFARNAKGEKKYIICNADEGDPGAFMDRSVLEGDPHSVLEGMMIAGRAIGADEAYIYIRAEYPKAILRLENAIKQCAERGYLGTGIFGSDANFKIKIKEGAGAFVCGEETALIASIEGKRGIPRIRPPFPAQKGLWGMPTNINNVETYANIPWIILNGAESFSSMGTEQSKGTKVFALAGKIVRSGLAEVPMGMTINEVVFDVGGGIKDDRKFKAVQMGGPSGGCIPASMGDLKIDYDEITQTGAIMGSGGLIVLDETTCMVDLAKFFLNFTQNESCGKCTFCRIGTKRMLEILDRITMGEGKEEDLDLLESLAYKIKDSSLCGLGQTAPNPVLTTLKYFREEYEAHIRDKKCPAHICPALITYKISAEKCTGCTLCAKKCPVQAISGEVKKPHLINQNECIKCGLCYDACSFGAVEKI
ncbi:MAG: NADH-quinone oxidoreductase subunit NuoF [Candidatus Aminicenantes bacterium]|nr:NADH-quinone oxidoreductase subunit NuoF [Candidatus Aminicenantes bacterium]